MLNPTDHHPKLWLLYSSATACFAVAVLGTLLRLVLLTHPTPVPQLELRAGDRAEMKTVGEYLEQALQFDRIAAEATDPALKASCQKQADAYRKLAGKRIALLPPVNLPAVRDDQRKR